MKDVIAFLNGGGQLERTIIDTRKEFYKNLELPEFDFADVKGQETVKCCMETAATGGHNIILVEPPESGKTMLAKRLPSTLPPMTLHEALETTGIHSVVERIKDNGLMSHRPLRGPRHTTSDVALMGGGTHLQPGETSLAHSGVLFLDELPELKRAVLEVVRQPLENREVTASRAKFSITYPASFMLVASISSSPSGYFNDLGAPMSSSLIETQRYTGKISGPLLGRIGIHIGVNPIPFGKLSDRRKTGSSSEMCRRVIEVRNIRTERFKEYEHIRCSAQMNTKQIQKFYKVSEESLKFLGNAMTRLSLSARVYDRILKIARTIANLEKTEKVKPHHIGEVIQYYSLDHDGWFS